MIRVIQAGMGGWGQDWAKNILLNSEEVELVACVDASAEALAHVQRKLNVPSERCFTALETALEQVEADAVIITATLPAHVPLALLALEAGKHVLVEKPFAPTLEEAQHVVDTAAGRGRVLMVSQNYRFFPAVRAAAALVREGTLGAVGMVNIDFRRYSNHAPREGHRHYTIQHPLLMDMSIHHFDLMRLVLGQEPQMVVCHAWNPAWSNFVEPAAAAATITFDGGAVVSYRGNWVSPGHETLWAGEWRMECALGEIAWTSRANQGFDADRATILPLGRKRIRPVELPVLQHIDRAGAVKVFVEAIHNGREPEASGRDNLRTLALMHAVVEAASTGQTVRVSVPASAA